jgi:uncharacterized protein
MDTSPFHAGEAALQAHSGMRERIDTIGRKLIRDRMPDPHRELFEKLPTLLVATLDDQGQPWATMLCDTPGFVHTPDDRTMHIAARPARDDPARAGWRTGAPIGVLGLEPHTRRRNRMNGVIGAVDAAGASVQVRQSFGNCPKYIQGRLPWHPTDRVAGDARAEGALLDDAARALVERSDTLFIASSSAAVVTQPGEAGEGVDISHRGGPPGFLRWERTGRGDRLTVPDYVGNFLFNTLGNLLRWPKAGLLFIDWERGDVLQLAATAELQFEGVELAAHPGAQRLLHLQVQHGWWRPGALPLAWTAPEPAPQFPMG